MSKPRRCHICGNKSEQYRLNSRKDRATCSECLRFREHKRAQIVERNQKLAEMFVMNYPLEVLCHRSGMTRHGVTAAVKKVLGDEYAEACAKRPRNSATFDYQLA